jgi:hypothetical protein
MKYTQKRYCRNCFYPLPYKAKFCSHCGQKDTDGRARMKDLFHQVWFKAFHLESKFFLILWHLFIPGKVSQEFFRGKQKRYPPPVQFFFVVMFFFLLVFGQSFSPQKLRVGGPGTKNAIIMEDWGDRPPSTLDQVLKTMYAEQQRRFHAEEMAAQYDSLPAPLKTAETRAALDSLLSRSGDDASPFGDSTRLSFFNVEYHIASRDIFLLEPDALLDKYGIHRWEHRLIVRQMLKSITDPTAMLNTYIGSFAWTVMVLIAVIALVLKLLYRRRGRYYVEHFIFLLHQHTSLFWFLTIVLLLGRLDFLRAWWIVPVIWAAVMPYLAMLRFYGQGWFKTLLKYLLFSYIYVFTFIGLFLFSVVVVFFLF